MEEILNQTNLKSVITFMHLAGLALGIGGAWTLDAFIFKHLTQSKITEDKFQVIEFISQLVTVGLVALWISGSFFITYYYYFDPELLGNEKVWAKVFIVTILTINGVFVHRMLLPKLRASIGSSLFQTLSRKDIRFLVAIGTVSFVSWVIPMILGVTKTLNFSVPGVVIVAFYFYALILALLWADLISEFILRRMNAPKENSREFASRPAFQTLTAS